MTSIFKTLWFQRPLCQIVVYIYGSHFFVFSCFAKNEEFGKIEKNSHNIWKMHRLLQRLKSILFEIFSRGGWRKGTIWSTLQFLFHLTLFYQDLHLVFNCPLYHKQYFFNVHIKQKYRYVILHRLFNNLMACFMNFHNSTNITL